ncbi:hypothetical protein ACETK8_16185 [Brevundimonas staleyi]|uniref:Uncharacterized protein n=1 Tax=Brevundimonas staleyi TaxID=74326 RepID=A0ABW0FU18_9CAUL
MTNRFKTCVRRLSAGLLMSSAIALVMFGQPARAMEQQREYQAFFGSRYNYCDAKLVGALYGQDVEGGKVIIGQKILNGIGDNVPVVLRESRVQGAVCEWEDTGLSYADAQTLAETWGFSDPYQAKLRAADLFTNGREQQVRNGLGQ